MAKARDRTLPRTNRGVQRSRAAGLLLTFSWGSQRYILKFLTFSLADSAAAGAADIKRTTTLPMPVTAPAVALMTGCCLPAERNVEANIALDILRCKTVVCVLQGSCLEPGASGGLMRFSKGNDFSRGILTIKHHSVVLSVGLASQWFRKFVRC